jgi:hypothetical protein
MRISGKRKPARDAVDRKTVSLPIAGDARYGIAPSAAGLIFVSHAPLFPVPPSNRWTKDTG